MGNFFQAITPLFNPLMHEMFFLNVLLIYIYIACDKQCAMATRVPNPISLYYT